MNALVILAAIALLIVFWSVGAYRRLARQRKQCNAAFAAMNAQSRRRCELVPALLAVAGACASGGGEALDAARAAHDELTAISQKARGNAFDLAAAKRLCEAEAALSDALALMQRHCDSAADADMRQCLEQWQAEEDKMRFARQVYNDAAARYNAARTQFPVAAIAFVFAFTPAAVLRPEA